MSLLGRSVGGLTDGWSAVWDDAVVMKPEDMQPEEHRKAAEEARKYAFEASKLDWEEENAEKTRKRLGIEVGSDCPVLPP